MINVVVPYSPRPGHEKAYDYTLLLAAQQRSVQRLYAHRHIVVSDQAIPGGYKVHRVHGLSDSLMHAILEMQIKYLETWDNAHSIVFVDVDCLIGRDLHEVFVRGNFHVGLTNRQGPHTSPINNGAMYINAGAREPALQFYRKALALCGAHWGGDQEAISAAAAPVPYTHGIEQRDGVLINFLSMLHYNTTPELEGVPHKQKPYVIHFKGEHRKPWMLTYERNFLRW